MLDFLRKKFIKQYVYSNIDVDRQCVKSVRINGRLYDKHGVDCATTFAALVYKVPVYGVKQFKYVILVGIARQNPCDNVLDKNVGAEIAIENAIADPIMTVQYSNEVTEETIYELISSYSVGLPIQFVKTRQEIIEDGKDLSDYERKVNNDSAYYNKYYADFKKIFFDE